MMMQLPPKPGTSPIPEGHVRLYHQTGGESLGSIKKEGLHVRHAKGIEGPKAIYASETGFYGSPQSRPTVEFHVPEKQWDDPIVRSDHVSPKNIIAVHEPWHQQARYAESNPEVIQNILAGKHDSLGGDYAKSNAYIKEKYGKKGPPGPGEI